MATPHVTGAIALLFSAADEDLLLQYQQNPAEIALLMKQFILDGVDIIPDLENVTVSGGRLNIFNSLQLLQNSSTNEEGITPVPLICYNYPNPFNPETTIYFTAENAEIIIYNLKGQKIRQYSIFNNQSSIVWDGTDENNQPVTSGIYLYKFQAGEVSVTKKMLMLK
ncbi:MAG: T9SS type A sorting domain-containing protein [Armatimonadetes bacterium]|nr:T9SS type A sorting domain-containing protein [Armatimonadota bacterium]